MSQSEINKCFARIQKEKKDREKKMKTYPNHYFPEIDERIYVQGFIGKPKGIKQILW